MLLQQPCCNMPRYLFAGLAPSLHCPEHQSVNSDKQKIVSSHQKQCNPLVKCVHKNQIPGIRITKAISKHQKKGGKSCQNPVSPPGNSLQRNLLHLPEKHQGKKSENPIPVSKYRQQIFQLLYIHCKQMKKSSIFCFRTNCT